jgi:hypothetical protein
VVVFQIQYAAAATATATVTREDNFLRGFRNVPTLREARNTDDEQREKQNKSCPCSIESVKVQSVAHVFIMFFTLHLTKHTP